MLFKRGKLTARHDKRTLRFSKYTAKLPAPPSTVGWQGKVPSYPMDGNDQYGDCTMAGAAHMYETWSYNAGTVPVNPSQDTVVQQYFQLTGGQDSGLNELDVLQTWQQSGLFGDKPVYAYAALKAGNQLELQQAVWLFGGAYLGLELPQFAVEGNMLEIPWVVPPGGAVGPDASPNPNEGHCVPVVGYGADWVYVVTWGALKQMSYEFYAAYADEAYAILSPDWLGAAGAPSGFDLAQLQADLADVTGEKRKWL